MSCVFVFLYSQGERGGRETTAPPPLLDPTNYENCSKIQNLSLLRNLNLMSLQNLYTILKPMSRSWYLLT